MTITMTAAKHDHYHNTVLDIGGITFIVDFRLDPPDYPNDHPKVFVKSATLPHLPSHDLKSALNRDLVLESIYDYLAQEP